MKKNKDYGPWTIDYRNILFRLVCLLSIVYGLWFFTGCLRVSGNAGYSEIQGDEMVTKSTGFDLDSSRLIDNRGVS